MGFYVVLSIRKTGIDCAAGVRRMSPDVCTVAAMSLYQSSTKLCLSFTYICDILRLQWG